MLRCRQTTTNNSMIIQHKYTLYCWLYQCFKHGWFFYYRMVILCANFISFQNSKFKEICFFLSNNIHFEQKIFQTTYLRRYIFLMPKKVIFVINWCLLKKIYIYKKPHCNTLSRQTFIIHIVRIHMRYLHDF